MGSLDVIEEIDDNFDITSFWDNQNNLHNIRKSSSQENLKFEKNAELMIGQGNNLELTSDAIVKNSTNDLEKLNDKKWLEEKKNIALEPLEVVEYPKRGSDEENKSQELNIENSEMLIIGKRKRMSQTVYPKGLSLLQPEVKIVKTSNAEDTYNDFDSRSNESLAIKSNSSYIKPIMKKSSIIGENAKNSKATDSEVDIKSTNNKNEKNNELFINEFDQVCDFSRYFPQNNHDNVLTKIALRYPCDGHLRVGSAGMKKKKKATLNYIKVNQIH